MTRKTPAPRPQRKRAGQYHHGDLRRALLTAAVGIIQTDGVAGLTLRSVGSALGVSRTALYRHFPDKASLLAAVAGEGFRTLRLALLEAWSRHGQGRAGFEAMGAAYVQFATTHPSHYRVMFGGFVESSGRDPELAEEAAGAFGALVEALVQQQQAGIVRADDPARQAQFVWAVVHGVAMLAIDGQLHDGDDPRAEWLTAYTLERLRAALAVPPSAVSG